MKHSSKAWKAVHFPSKAESLDLEYSLAAPDLKEHMQAYYICLEAITPSGDKPSKEIRA